MTAEMWMQLGLGAFVFLGAMVLISEMVKFFRRK